MDKMQESFNKAFSVVFEKIEITPEVAEKIRNVMLQLYSSGWYDSLDSRVVELSSLPRASYTDSDTVYLSHIEDLLDKAGIKYK
jgi:hypothetical protein